jgi:hypothetical protein
MKMIDLDFNFGVYRLIQIRHRNHQKPEERQGKIGYGWSSSRTITCLAKDGNDYILHHTTGNSMRFIYDAANKNYVFKKDPQTRLCIEKSLYRIVRKDQSIWLFNKNAGGRLEQINCTDGQKVLFEYDSSGRASLINAYCNENQIYGTVTFDYLPTGALSEIVIRLTNQNGKLQNHSRVCYGYYGEHEQNGNNNDLKTVTRFVGKDTSWESSGTYYYRYYRNGDSRGHYRGMKLFFKPEHFANMDEKFGQQLFETSDNDVMPYASGYYEYDLSRRTVLEYSSYRTKQISYETFAEFTVRISFGTEKPKYFRTVKLLLSIKIIVARRFCGKKHFLPTERKKLFGHSPYLTEVGIR